MTYHCRYRAGASYSQTAVLIWRRPTALRAVVKDAVGSSARVRVLIVRTLLRLFCAMEIEIVNVKCDPICTRTTGMLFRMARSNHKKLQFAGFPSSNSKRNSQGWRHCLKKEKRQRPAGVRISQFLSTGALCDTSVTTDCPPMPRARVFPVLNFDQVNPSRQRLSLSMIVQLAFDGTAPTTSIREVLDRRFWRPRLRRAC